MQDARATLRDELGLDPGQALQQLEKAILLQDPSLDRGRHAGRHRPRRPGAPDRRGRGARTGLRELRHDERARRRLLPGVRRAARADVTIETRKTVTALLRRRRLHRARPESLDPEALRRVMLALTSS